MTYLKKSLFFTDFINIHNYANEIISLITFKYKNAVLDQVWDPFASSVANIY